ncbi:protein kinase family protein [Streptomyces sp. NPDC052051]|uniref:protein kinase family protein n=1 Tax=Streptomyces sp. NPDC052051 TaxID=3154649 RepID=UPI0034148266
MSPAARLAAHSDIATALALVSDRDLAGLVASGTPLGVGIGGRSVLIEVEGRKVFVKRVPLTDVERLPENARSTANLLHVPPVFHYGLGNPGFGAWRELAVHTMTTNWVLAGRFSGFPLMHHWRVLSDTPQPLHEELADVERVVAYWGGAPQVRERLEALRTATANVTLFLEYLPHTVHEWLGARLASGDADAACALVERQLRESADFLEGQGVVHFDAHFENVLTDGRRLFLCDYGLTLSSRFRLAGDEREFLNRHRGYDHAYSAAHFVNWLVTALYGYGRKERDAFVRACAEGERPQGVPPTAARIITHYAPLTAARADFVRRLQDESRWTPYPHERLRDLYNRRTVSA